MLKQVLWGASFAALLASGLATAGPVYQYEVSGGDVPGQNANAGAITNISTTFDTNTEVFSWSHTINDKGGKASDGFWLVVSDGPNPKGNVDEFAILYGDADTNTLTAYIYDGVNSANSHTDAGSYLDTFNLGYTDNGNSGTFSFSFDATTINSLFNTPDWDGVSFGANMGIWLHPMLDANFGYDQNGLLTSLGYSAQGWLDTKNRNTVNVVEPSALLLMGFGLFGLGLARRRS